MIIVHTIGCKTRLLRNEKSILLTCVTDTY